MKKRKVGYRPCEKFKQWGKVEISMTWLEASLGKKLGRPYLNNKLGVVVHACDSSYARGNR
jgi:hypothetical protein